MAKERLKYRPEQVAEAITKASGIIAAAARLMGTDRNTIRRYIDNHEIVKVAYDQANEVVMDEAEGRLISLLRDAEHKDHFQALRFYLRTKARTRGYVERQEIAGVEGQPVTVNFVPADG